MSERTKGDLINKMNTVYMKDIDDTNESTVRNIRIKPGQEKYIESVDECLAEAKEIQEFHPVAICSEEDIVGFAMYGSFGPDKDTWIDRIMIDEKFQGKGLGRKAMLNLIDIVQKEYDINEIYLSIIEGNEAAQHLYNSIGFVFTNEKDPNGELIFKYTVNKRRTFVD
ncbi:GNAT family N-acetyltransferase [Jeotgalibaca sp. MA1X17-3]|uniref:GNAT family N-acetyltransferase n=1 Tax=Jeotgalibaca sp. MA1X17-3 TaxID=2908211 RepID=UPI001F1B32F5|nr:GNAT family N-acetyltransferase [Jeotgalibaca sp. MA1X17-3]UJF15911.1 GNAT family N-acetyltransferase [Jeotgalibaca sp. MA1X17-3]